MSTTYAQRQTTAQKKDAPSASSVFDASSQSESLQCKASMANGTAQRVEPPRPNNTGMPDNLKAGIESLSGFSMDDVRVHYNSSKPATVQALAYTQGTDIHVAPGQEKHLPHEAWHVAQQMAGRVSPTTNINGMLVNDNAGLEHEADVMGEKAVQCKFFADGKRNFVCVNKESVQLKKCIQCVGDKIWIQKNVLDRTDEKKYNELKALQDEYFIFCKLYEDSFKINRMFGRIISRNAIKEKQDAMKKAKTSAEKHNIADPLVQGYEKNQIQYCLSVENLKKFLQKKIGENNPKGISLSEESECLNVKCNDVILLSIWIDNNRFELSTNLGDAKPKIYHRKGDAYEESDVDGEKIRRYKKEYVQTANGCFVPRFVYRNLNTFDKNHLEYQGESEIKKIVDREGDYVFCDVDSRNPISLQPDKDDVLDPKVLETIIARNSKKDQETLYRNTGDYSYHNQKNEQKGIGSVVELILGKNDIIIGNVSVKKAQRGGYIKNLIWLYYEKNAPQEDISKDLIYLGEKRKKIIIKVANKINRNVEENKRKMLYKFYGCNRSESTFWKEYNASIEPDKMNEEILDHQRFKEQQGGSGFVSCTATKHPIFGSTCCDFFQAEDPQKEISAVAKIDLAKIETEKIYSTYSKDAMRNLYGKGVADYVPRYDGQYAFDPKVEQQSFEYENNAAARDAMRTREIVIDGPIPKEAIVQIYYDKRGDVVHTFEDYGVGNTQRLVWPPKPPKKD